MVDFPSLDTVHPQAAQMHAPMMHPQQGQIAHQAQPTRRLATIFGSFAGGSFFLLALILIGELAFKDDLRPSQLLGDFYGNASRAQIEASTDAQVSLEQQLAEVRAQEQAKAQEQVARVQSQLDTTREAYGSLYRRAETLATGFMQKQQQMMTYRAEDVRAGSAGGGLVNMGTGFMCAMSRANNDGDPDGWCSANDRVRSGQVNDMQGAVAISREQLDQELFGGLPDPAIERVNRDRQQTNR